MPPLSALTLLLGGVRKHAARIFRSSHAAGQVCFGLTTSLALLERLPRYRILDRSCRGCGAVASRRDAGREVAGPGVLLVSRRYFPQLAAARQTKPPVDELTMSLTDNLAIVDVWAGSAELTIPEVRGEDMHSLAPLRLGRGFRLGMSYSVTDLRILKNYVA
jgi:hypothetical protein